MLIYARPLTGLELYHVILEHQRGLQVASDIIYSYRMRGLELRLVSRVDAGVLLCTYVEILILSLFFCRDIRLSVRPYASLCLPLLFSIVFVRKVDQFPVPCLLSQTDVDPLGIGEVITFPSGE